MESFSDTDSFLVYLDKFNKILTELYEKYEIDFNISNLAVFEENKRSFYDFLEIAFVICAYALKDFLQQATDNYKNTQMANEPNFGFSINYYSKYGGGLRLGFKCSGKDDCTNETKTFVFKKEANFDDLCEIDLSIIKHSICENLDYNHEYVKLLGLFYNLANEHERLRKEKSKELYLFSIMDYFKQEGKDKPIIKFTSEELSKTTFNGFKRKYKIETAKEFDYESYYKYLEIAFNEDYNISDKHPLASFWKEPKVLDVIKKWKDVKLVYNQYCISANDPFSSESRANVVIFTDISLDDKILEKLKFISDYFITSLSELEFRFESELRELKLFLANLESAIISILVDSYAHNISAHSLSALEWWFSNRSKFLERRICLEDGLNLNQFEPINISKQTLEKIAEQGEEYYKFLNLTDSVYNKEFSSILDFLKFVNDNDNEWIKWLSFRSDSSKVKKSHEDVPRYYPRFPVPLDYAIWPFFRFLRDKAGFWSGVTRDLPFGGMIKNWYDVLWKDFAKNPLYLGTIAHSEEINKIIIFVKLNGENEKRLCSIDLSIIKDEFELMDLNAEEENERINKNGAIEQNSPIKYSKYAFVRIDEEHKELKDRLEKMQVFLPGGLVGEHAFFTILENTIRNIKHYKRSPDWNNIKENGINLCISIAPKYLMDLVTGKEQLYKIEIWLDHLVELVDQEGKRIIENVKEISREPVVDENRDPRLGGNAQDKICAAMLMNNTFSSVENKDSEKEKYYNNDKMSWIGFEEDKKGKNNGILKKYFYMWQGDFIFIPKNIDDLSYENISRFKFVFLTKELENKYYEPISKDTNGNKINRTMRIINEDDLKTLNGDERKEIGLGENFNFTVESLKERNEDIDSALYLIWLKKFINKQRKDICIGRPSGNRIEKVRFIKEFNFVGEDGISKDSILIKFAHGTNRNPSEILDYRSHGVLRERFALEGDDLKGDWGNEYEFIETLLMNIIIFDNRLEGKIPKNKLQLYKKQLFMQFMKEESDKWRNNENNKNIFKENNVLIIHLSFIEELGYDEEHINDFIKQELGITEKTPVSNLDRFILVITSGRGRLKWMNNLDGYQKRFTIFRPIESLLSAVGDAVKYKDDFQIKYNLAKVILGS